MDGPGIGVSQSWIDLDMEITSRIAASNVERSWHMAKVVRTREGDGSGKYSLSVGRQRPRVEYTAARRVRTVIPGP
jgi:hypothetical protein